MNRLNYFNPYDSKAGSHEDQLTRAYLVILKYSSHALIAFVEYCRSEHKAAVNEKPISKNKLLKQSRGIETQKGNPEIKTDYLLSILITDSQMKPAGSSVQPSERNARYDGIITFGSDLTMVIENKPRSENVWFEQMNPSRQNLAKNTKIYSNFIVLEWKEIIKQLNNLLETAKVSGSEEMLIKDFFAFVDENKPLLNPYDGFHQCKGNAKLINRRINNLLKSIAQDESKVDYHQNGSSYIQTPYPEVERICLGSKRDKNGYSITLDLCFGDSPRQAIAFYKSNPSIRHLKNSEWSCRPNFHVSFMASNLVSFQTKKAEPYLEFWKENVKEIRQQKKKDVPKYIKWLVDERVIDMTKESEEQLNKKFTKTAMPTLNICPGFVIACTFNSSIAEELDKNDKLKFVLVEKIKEALKVTGRDANEILKKL